MENDKKNLMYQGSSDFSDRFVFEHAAFGDASRNW